MTKQVPFYETLDLNLCAHMGRVHRICRDAVTIAVEPMGLTQSRWTVLMHVSLLKENATQLEVARSLGIEMPSLTRTLKQLEEQLLITRCVDEEDKRSKKIYFTEQGRVVMEAVKEKIADIRDQLYSGLSTEQLDAIAYGLVEMEKNAQNCIQNQVNNRAKS